MDCEKAYFWFKESQKLQQLTIKKISLKFDFTISLLQKKIQDEDYFFGISSNQHNSVSLWSPLWVCSTSHYFMLIGGDIAQEASSHSFPFHQTPLSPPPPWPKPQVAPLVLFSCIFFLLSREEAPGLSFEFHCKRPT